MNALLRSRRTTSRVCAVAATMTLIAAAWAFRPLRRPHAVEDAAAPSSAPTIATAIESSAFEVELWATGVAVAATVIEAAPEPALPAAPPPPPTLRVQLIGIHAPTGDNAPLQATLYDPDADRLLVVTTGDVVAGREVAIVDDRGVVLRLNALEQRLSLREESLP